MTFICFSCFLFLLFFSAVSVCKLNSLAKDVVASPFNPIYSIGERVTLSCPEGRTLEGEAMIICDPSLHFSPDPANIKCSQGIFLKLMLIGCCEQNLTAACYAFNLHFTLSLTQNCSMYVCPVYNLFPCIP